jgi:hypothetical protein
MTMTNRIARWIRVTVTSVTTKMKPITTAVRIRIRGIWQAHTLQMRHNRSYRTAIAVGLTAIITALTLDRIAAASLSAVVTIYAAFFADEPSPYSGQQESWPWDHGSGNRW